MRIPNQHKVVPTWKIEAMETFDSSVVLDPTEDFVLERILIAADRPFTNEEVLHLKLRSTGREFLSRMLNLFPLNKEYALPEPIEIRHNNIIAVNISQLQPGAIRVHLIGTVSYL